MSEQIPKDIMQAAADAFEELLDKAFKQVGFDRSHYQLQGTASKDIIARAILAERQREQWQPIETAPKNSSEPYICYSRGNPRAHNEYAREPHYHIDGFSERWPRGRNQYPEAPYTHWMPLPAAPKGGDA